MNRRPTPATLLLLPLAFACQAAESPSVQRHYLLGTDADEIAAIAEVYEVDPLALASGSASPHATNRGAPIRGKNRRKLARIGRGI